MRTLRPLDEGQITVRILLLISQRIGKPCPTRNELQKVTDLPKRKVWLFMDELHRQGVLEIEERAIRPGNWRRMRIAGGKWTDWTARHVRKRRFPLQTPSGETPSGPPSGPKEQ
jgi:hypothetical protein